MNHPPRSARAGLAALGVAIAMTLASCSGSSKAAVDTTAASTPPTTVATTTTVASTTTTVLSTTTTVEPCSTFAPLTGLCTTDDLTQRPALVVKIDNHPDALPQTGLNEADLVYEELVEGISRFAAVFQSQTTAAVGSSAPVGPIRSARTSDIDILAGLYRPLFAWSGGNPTVSKAVSSASKRGEIRDIGFNFKSQEGGYYRDKGRQAPHNLFANTLALFSLAASDQLAPKPVFTYRDATEAVTDRARDIGGVNLRFSGMNVTWAWDAASSTWLRSESAGSTPRRHLDSAGTQLYAANVVVLFTPYGKSPADPKSPEAKTVGKGTAWVFTAGKLIDGCWARPTRTAPAAITFCDTNMPIKLTPGRTWVELPRGDRGKPDNAVFFEAGTDPTKATVP